jgi:hypothetical protein
MIFSYSFGDEIFFLASMMLKGYNSLGMGLRILLRQIDFGDFLMVATRTVILVKFVPTASSTTMVIYIPDHPAMLSMLFGCYSLIYWCWYFYRY